MRNKRQQQSERMVFGVVKHNQPLKSCLEYVAITQRKLTSTNLQCRRRKVRCDREQPCANCVLAYKPENCFYQPDPMVAQSPPTRAARDQIVPESRCSLGDQALRTGSLESDWPGSMTGTATSSNSVTGASTPARFATLPLPVGGASVRGGGSIGGNPYYRHDNAMSRSNSNRESALPSPGPSSQGPLPGISAVTGESEVTSLKEQVRRLESRLALVMNDQEESRLPRPCRPHHSPHRGPYFALPHHRPPHLHWPPHHHGPPHHGSQHPWPPFPHHYPLPPPPHIMHPHHHNLPYHDRQDQHERHDSHHSAYSQPQPTHPTIPPSSTSFPAPSPLEPRFESFRHESGTQLSASPTSEEGCASTKTRYLSQGHWMNGALFTIMVRCNEIELRA